MLLYCPKAELRITSDLLWPVISLYFILHRSEVSKTSVQFINKPDRGYNGASQTAPRCCLDTEQDRRSPTGRAETVPDTSETNIDITHPSLRLCYHATCVVDNCIIFWRPFPWYYSNWAIVHYMYHVKKNYKQNKWPTNLLRFGGFLNQWILLLNNFFLLRVYYFEQK